MHRATDGLYGTAFPRYPPLNAYHPASVTKACSVCQVNLPLNGSECESCSLNGTLCQTVQQLRPCLPHDPGVRTRSRRPKSRRIRLPQSDPDISRIQQQSDNIQRRVQAISLLWTQEVETCRIQAEQRRDVSVLGGADITWLHEIQERSGPVLPHRVQYQRQGTRVLVTRAQGKQSSSSTQVSRLYQIERAIQHRRTSQEVARLGSEKVSEQDQAQAPGGEKKRSTTQAQPGGKPGLSRLNTERLDGTSEHKPDKSATSPQSSLEYRRGDFQEGLLYDTTKSSPSLDSLTIICYTSELTLQSILDIEGHESEIGELPFRSYSEGILRNVFRPDPTLLSQASSCCTELSNNIKYITLLIQLDINLIPQEQIESLTVIGKTGLNILRLPILQKLSKIILEYFQNKRSKITSQLLKQFLIPFYTL